VTVGRLRAAVRAALGAGDAETAADLLDRTAGAYGDGAVAGLRSALDRVRAGDRAARAAAVRGAGA
jgi:ATP/maltotriose-dependent transcriptional regulator MalT